MKWWKHINCTICVLWDLHISLSIGDCIKRARERERERKRGREREWADSLSGHFIWNMNSYMISVCTSSLSLHLTTLGGEILSLSGYFIWEFWLIWSWSLHLTSSRGVYLTAYLGTSSENLNSHLILVTSSDKLWGVYLTAYLGTSSEIWTHILSWSLHLTSYGGYIWPKWALHLTTWPAKMSFNNITYYNWQMLALIVEILEAMSVAMWNCHSWPVDVSSNVKLPFLTSRCQ